MTIAVPGKDTPVRLISYLSTVRGAGGTYALGMVDGYRLALRHLWLADDDSTIFYVDGNEGGFRLYSGQDRSKFLVWGSPQEDLFFSNNKNFLIPQASSFVLQGEKADPWFALYDWQHRRWVIDVAGSHTDDKGRVLSWNWNGGDNQIWRMEPVKASHRSS